MNPPRPNIMLIVGEDTGRHHGCYGDPVGHTPNLDKLASEGTLYTNACSTAPVCAPSRSTLISGQYAFSLGSHHMRSTLVKPPRTFTEELIDAGYYVNWSNKTDFNFTPRSTFSTEISDWTEALRERRLPGSPWFLYMNLGITHESSLWKEKWETSVASQLAPEERQDPATVPIPPYLPDCQDVREELARYYDALRIQDREAGKLLDALDASGERDNTIVIYLTDHGRGVLREKRWCYDAGTHLPLIIRWPGKLAAGVRDDRMVSWVDIGPTLLNLTGVAVPEHYQGQIFLGDQATPRDYCFAGRDRMDEGYDCVRTIRDKRFLFIKNDFPDIPYAQPLTYMEKQRSTQLVRQGFVAGTLPPAAQLWMQPGKQIEELYDTQADPHCINNLAEDTAYAPECSRFRTALAAFRKEINDLGWISERELIERGIAVDRRPEYAARMIELPESFAPGPRFAILERPE